MLKSRLFFCNSKLLFNKDKESKLKKIWSRSSVILPFMLNNFYYVYNGKVFIKVKIDYLKLFSKFGVYSKTRQDFFYPLKNQIKKK